MGVCWGLRERSRVTATLLAGLGGCGLTACASVTPQPYASAPPAPQPPAAASPASSAAPVAAAPSKVPRRRRATASSERQARLGAPYSVKGVWYTPAEQRDYDEVGLASWYGESFHGRATASGEVFDMDAISAAHATLPIPSIVEVTNLDNGRTLKVRLNDRGPFHPGRIIDLSRAAAQSLGFYQSGTARVRVRFVSSAPVFTQASLASAARTSSPLVAASGYVPSRSARTVSVLTAYSPAEPFGPYLQEASYHPAASSGSMKYWLQAGAYTRSEAARAVAGRLRALGETTVTPITLGAKGQLYRLGVGPFTSYQSAQAASARAAALGVPRCRVRLAN